MKFKLDEDQYQTLKKIDFSEIGSSVEFLDDETSVSVTDSKVRLFRVIITEEIDANGLTNNQNDVLPYGRKLYAIHDSIYEQWEACQSQK